MKEHANFEDNIIGYVMIELIALSARDIDNFVIPGRPFCAWLHIDKRPPKMNTPFIYHLINEGCLNIQVTGDLSKEISDEIDEVIENQYDCLILTSRYEYNPEKNIDSFITAGSPDKSFKSRLLIVSSRSEDRDQDILKDLVPEIIRISYIMDDIA